MSYTINYHFMLWIRKFKSACDSINDAPKLGRPCATSSKSMVEKVHACDEVRFEVRLPVHKLV